ncbi:MAG: hypothetical protein ACTH2Q_02380 [Propionibacteriaceae bacterium]
MTEPSGPNALPDAISDYAARLHASRGDHHVASPLGAWLLLALAAQAAPADHPSRAELTAALGMDIGDAGDAARSLLAHPHPDLLTATGAWLHESARTQRITAWAAALPADTSRGRIPTQAELDEWARRNTDGLIKEFPLDVDPRTVFLLATAIAARISWAVPFEDCAAERLGGTWAGQLESALRSPTQHPSVIVDTPAGRALVHEARSTEGLRVLSVFLPGADPADQRALAHRLATTPRTEWACSSLFDLDLGDHPSGSGDDSPWTITESEISGRTDTESVHSVLPAWRTRVEIDLMAEPSLGLAAAGAAIADLLPPENRPYEAEAVQTCVAEYTRTGFAAAAVSALGVRMTALPTGRARLRAAELRFNQPYAVVAVTEEAEGTGPWHLLPVFSGWISDPAAG